MKSSLSHGGSIGAKRNKNLIMTFPLSSGGASPAEDNEPYYGIHHKPRANPPPIRAIELMGLNLHQEREPSRDVDQSDVTQMRSKMNQHSEETNELYNLMARHIKKRCEERINLYTIESKGQSAKAKTTLSDNNQNILMDE